MKKRHYFSVIIAAVLMMISPMTMACASCHVESGVDTYQTSAVDIGQTDTLIQANKQNIKLMAASGVMVSITAYSEPRTSIEYKPASNGKTTNNNGVVANKQAKPYAGVTTA